MRKTFYINPNGRIYQIDSDNSYIPLTGQILIYDPNGIELTPPYVLIPIGSLLLIDNTTWTVIAQNLNDRTILCKTTFI